MRLSIKLCMLAALFVVGIQKAHAAKSEAQCVQQILSDIGYQVSVDGQIGPQTRKITETYLQNAKLLGTGTKVDLPPISNETAATWCTELQKAHQDVIPVRLSSFVVKKKGDFWLLNESGLMPIYFHQRPDADINQIVVFIHGDEVNESWVLRWCQQRQAQLELQNLPIEHLMIACIFRGDTSSEYGNRRKRIELQRMTKTIATIQKIFNGVPVSCFGHSGGGHLCVATSQQREISYECLVVAAPVLSVYRREEVQFGSTKHLSSQIYDPVRYIEKTSAKRIIIVGDPTGKDEKVHKIGWEDFIDKAGNRLQIDYQKAEGAGHYAYLEATDSMAECLQREALN